MTLPLTYVYCLVHSARRPVLRALPEGIGGEEVRALAAGDDLWLIVTNVPAAEYEEDALARGLQNFDWVGRRAMAHESIVDHFLSARAVLPMQLFTLFTSDERALAHVARDRRRIDSILARLAGHVEWGLRLTFDEQAARRAVEQKRASRVEPSGAGYLARKRDLLDVRRVQLTAAKAEADRLYRAMSRSATEAVRRTSTEQAAPGSRLLLDAAFLVQARQAAGFRSALRQHTRTLSPEGIVVSLTGPWPAYNFIATPSSSPARGRKSSRGRAGSAASSSPASRRAGKSKSGAGRR